MIAKLDADHYKEIGGKYGVSGFPTLIWFPKDNKAGEKYERGRDVQTFVDFINEKTGTKRIASGRLQDTAGRVTALDALASQFSSGDKAALLKEAEKITKSLSGDEKKYLLTVKRLILSGTENITPKLWDSSNPKELILLTLKLLV